MRLTDLDAEFVVSRVPRQIIARVDTLAEAQGVRFDCPGCRGHWVLVWFVDRGAPDVEMPAPRWHATGSSLDDLTLDPSISLPEAVCGWHGRVKDGDVA